MRSIVEIIAAKRDGHTLPDDEIRWLIAEYSADRLPDYQMSALAMAIFFRGLDHRETGTWTEAMLRSGVVLDLSDLGAGRVDKHSTGGVGDKISLPLAPAAAACGCIVPMVSGRGLGHTGGTLDKLEAIPGYRTDLDVAAFRAVLADVGCSIIGQTGEVAPADKRLYALRDVTGTVESIPLITASIMSKKLAEGIEGLVLDVKVGGAAFMKNVEDARRLAEAMVQVGEGMGKRVIAFLTRMEEPLGQMIGNACEVAESIEVLGGGGPADVRELVVTLGGAMVELARGVSADEGAARVAQALDDGSALQRWRRMVAHHGGDDSRLPAPTGETAILASRDGYVTAIDGLEIGLSAVALGAGRTRADQAVDPVVGVRIDAPRGAKVAAGGRLATVLHGRGGAPPAEVTRRIADAFRVGSTQPEPAPLVIERIG
ncbi:MAG: thymidine phosphorylase [Deltaproteobacteria bacterium]|nr:thymidine phosphorylase [Deltaproteobacteria bacterium]